MKCGCCGAKRAIKLENDGKIYHPIKNLESKDATCAIFLQENFMEVGLEMTRPNY